MKKVYITGRPNTPGIKIGHWVLTGIYDSEEAARKNAKLGEFVVGVPFNESFGAKVFPDKYLRTRNNAEWQGL